MAQAPYLGAAYYPEAWPPETVEEDIGRARELGINTFRIGEFAWSRMERREGAYDFAWLHAVVDRLQEAGIGVVLGTPTATPPAWLTRRYPEVLVVGREGRAYSHGGRRHGCPTSPLYRRLSRSIVQRMAEEFASHPNVIGWQIDNEFGCHVNECFCPACRERWPKWLADNYGSLEALNEAWGTELWSQYYTDWEEIPVPLATPAMHHPSLLYCWRRYMSDMYAEYSDEQRRVLNAAGAAPVSTDGMPHFHRLDYERMYRDLDLVQSNCYFPPDGYAAYVGECDWMRPVKTRPYWFTESAVGWTGGGCVGSLYLPKPGSIRARGWLSFALGGEMVCYWLWRGHWSGQEMLHGSLIHAWGEPTSGSEEIARLSKDLDKAGEFLRETRVSQSEVAIHWHTPAQWMLDHEPQVPGLDYGHAITEWFHRPLVEANVPRDLIFSRTPLAGYKLLFSPFLAWLPEETLQAALRAVHEGMTWVVGPMTSIRSQHATRFRDSALGPLEAELPVRVARRFPATGLDPRVTWADSGRDQRATLFCDAFEREDGSTRVLATYAEGPCAGAAAAVEIPLDKGRVVLLGFMPDPTDATWLSELVAQAGAGAVCPASEGIAVVRREATGLAGWIVFDWAGNGGSASLPGAGTELLSGRNVSGEVTLEPYGVAVVRVDG